MSMEAEKAGSGACLFGLHRPPRPDRVACDRFNNVARECQATCSNPSQGYAIILFFRDLFEHSGMLPPQGGGHPAALPLAVYREAGRVSRPSTTVLRPFIPFFTKDHPERVSGDAGSVRFRTSPDTYDCVNKQLHTPATSCRRPCDGMRMPSKRHRSRPPFSRGGGAARTQRAAMTTFAPRS